MTPTDETFTRAIAAAEQRGRDESAAYVKALEKVARELSIFATHVAGGGSEMFKRVGDEFYADGKLCRERYDSRTQSVQRLIEARSAKRIAELEEAMRRLETAGRAYLFANFNYANANAELVDGEPPTGAWHRSLAALGECQVVFTNELNTARALAPATEKA